MKPIKRRRVIGVTSRFSSARIRPAGSEPLERRMLLANFVVTTTADSGPGSLRDAITLANGTAEPDVINFNIPGVGPHMIQPVTPLPAIAAAGGGLTIDGFSQPGASPNTLPVGNNAVIKIQLDGGAMQSPGHGLVLQSGGTIRGLSITGFVGTVSRRTRGDGQDPFASVAYALFGDSTSNVDLGGLSLGVDPAGLPRGNGGGFYFGPASYDITIGGVTPQQRVTISANIEVGAVLRSSASAIYGSYVGTTPAGGSGMPNGGDGLVVSGTLNTIGGAGLGRNISSGNDGWGMRIEGRSHAVRGNFFGLGAGGERFGNLFGGVLNFSKRLEFGDRTDPHGGNVVAYNHGNGFEDRASPQLRARYNINYTHSNGNAVGRQLGIDHVGGNENAFGVTLNDASESDGIQNFPVLTSATTNTRWTQVGVSLHSYPNAGFRFDFYGNRTVDPSGHGEGERWLGSTEASTDSSGDVTISPWLLATAMPFITATVTRTDIPGSTSEFAVNVANAIPPAIIVTNANPDGPGSYLQATIDAASVAGPNSIVFDLAGTTGVVIAPSANSPGFDEVLLDAFTAGMYGSMPRVYLNGRALSLINDSTIRGMGSVFAALAVNFPPQPPNVATGDNTLADCAIAVQPNYTNGGFPGLTFGANVTIQTGNNDNRLINNLFHHGGNRTMLDIFSNGNTAKGNRFGIVPGDVPLNNNSGGVLFQAFASNNNISWNKFANLQSPSVLMFSGTGNKLAYNQYINVTTPAVDLGGTGATPNDAGDGDTGANNLQNYPVLNLAEAVAGGTHFAGSLDSDVAGDYWIGFYTEQEVGIRRTYIPLGYRLVTADANGDASFDFVESWATQFGQRVVVNAISPTDNTSELSDFTTVADTTAPTIFAGEYDFEAGFRLQVQLSENVSASIDASDLVVQTVAETDYMPSSVFFDPATNTAFFNFDGPFPDGNYTATIAAGSIADLAGNTLAAPFAFDFFVLAGDANRDRVVDITDLGILATNWQGTGKSFSEGDFNRDGTVDITDLGILATNWQKNVPMPAAPTASSPVSARPIATRAIEQIEEL